LKVLNGALFLWTLWVFFLGLPNLKMTLATLNTSFHIKLRRSMTTTPQELLNMSNANYFASAFLGIPKHGTQKLQEGSKQIFLP